MVKLDLEKAEEPEIKLPTSVGSKKWEHSRKASTSALLTTKAFDCVDHNQLWKILKEMGILDHLICLLRNLYAGQEATVRTEHGTMDWFQIKKGVCQGYILSPCLFNFYAEYICKMLGWMKHKLESRLLGEISITSDMQMTPPLWQWRGTEELLDECERGEWKSWLKIQYSKKGRSWHLVPSLHGKQMGKWWQTLFSWAPKSLPIKIN